MSAIILPFRGSWYDMVKPRPGEMEAFLRVLITKEHWRIPKRRWQELWMLRRGELGKRQFAGPKFQRGSVGVGPYGTFVEPVGGGVPTVPNLQTLTNLFGNAAPTPARQQFGYDSDGSIVWDEAQGVLTVVYADLGNAQTNDGNDHTNDWWPDQPDVNEGLNWDIRYLNEALTGSGGAPHYFKTLVPADRVSGTWYLLDTVSNDIADATNGGAIALARGNGTSKTPDSGTATLNVDVEIRATGSGSAVASHHLDLDTSGTNET